MAHETNTQQTSPIVVGIDGSDYSQRAFDIAAGIAQQRQVPLRVVAAYTEPGYEYVPEHAQGLAKLHAEETLRDTMGSVESTGVTVSGDAAGVLVTESETASLVVVGKRGRSRFAGRFLGSTSASLAAHAHCPVLIVPGRGLFDEQPEHQYSQNYEETGIGAHSSDEQSDVTDFTDIVVVAVDLESTSPELVNAAAQYAQERNLSLALVTAQQLTGSMWMPMSPMYQHEIPDLRKEFAARLANYAAEVAEETQVQVHWRFFDATPADTLANASKTANMVAVGTRGRGGFAGLLLGSVSQAVLNRATCPVLVVPTGR